MTTKERIYFNALVNISKLGGVCWDWDSGRECQDPQYVATKALIKADKELGNYIDNLPYDRIKVNRNGDVTIRQSKKQTKVK